MHEIDRLGDRFVYAIRGVIAALKTEQSFRIQSLGALIVIGLIIWLRPPRLEAALLTLVTALVIMLELVNSIFERVVDLLKPRLHSYVGEVKDMMAASVLIASITAVVIGVIILGPLIMKRFY